MSYDIILIDANSIGYAAMYQPNLARLAHDGQSTAALHGLPMSVFKLMKRFPEATPILLWDGKARWRYERYPEYKSDRKADPEKVAIRDAYAAQVPHLRRLFFDLGLPQMGHPDTEADDLAGMITRRIVENDDTLNILLSTTDSDWVQSLHERVHWFKTSDETLTDLARLASEDFKDGPFDTPEQYLAAKCLAGDSSDSIEGIPGIGLKTGAKFHREYGDFETLWARADAGEKFKGAKLQSILTPEARALYLRNREIMDWRQAPIPDDVSLSCPAPDMASAIEITERFGLKRIQDAMRSTPMDRAAWGPVLWKIDQLIAEPESAPAVRRRPAP